MKIIKIILNMLVSGWQVQSQLDKAKKELKKWDNTYDAYKNKIPDSTADNHECRSRMCKIEGERRILKLDLANTLLHSENHDY